MARAFDLTATDWLSFGDSADFKLLGDLTWSAWLRLPSSNTTSRVIVAIEGGPGETEAENATFFLDLQGSSNAWDLRYIHEFSTGTNQLNSFNTNISDDTWTHIAFVRDVSANTVICYKDGSAVSTYNYTTDPTNTSSDLEYTLASRSGGAQPLTIDFAEVGLWDTPLTADEIAGLAAGYSPRFFPVGRISYGDLVRDARDHDGDRGVSLTGSTVLDHPRVIYPPALTAIKAIAALTLETLSGTNTGAAEVTAQPIFKRVLSAVATALSGPATLVSVVTETLSAAVTGSATFARLASLFRTLSAAVTGVGTIVVEQIIDLVTQTLSATATAAASLNAARLIILEAVAAALSGAATIVSVTAETLSATVTGSASKVSLFFRTLSATVAGVADMIAQSLVDVTQVVLSATATGLATLRRMHFEAFDAAVTAIVGAQQVFAIIVFSPKVTAVATMVAQKITELTLATLSAVTTGAATMRRMHFKAFEAVATALSGAATIVSIATETLSATVTASATLVADAIIEVVLSAATTAVATLNRFASLFRTFAATVTGSATLARFSDIFVTFAATVTGAAEMARLALLARIFEVTATGVARIEFIRLVILAAIATVIARILADIETAVVPWSGHGGLGLGLSRQRWQRRARTLRRRARTWRRRI